MRQFTVRTTAKYELADITKLVTEIFASTPIQTGLLTVFVPHTTAAIVCNEHEPRLKSDILRVVKTVEKQSVFFGGFKHNADEGNAHAHIISALTGPSRSFIAVYHAAGDGWAAGSSNLRASHAILVDLRKI